MIKHDEELLTMQELCGILKVCRQTVYNLMDRAALPRPVMRMGRNNRWSKAAVLAWIADQRPPGVVSDRKEKGSGVRQSSVFRPNVTSTWFSQEVRHGR